MEEIQDRRAKKAVPGGRPLHHYACLYFNARNKMMYKICHRHQELCVLRVSPDVLDLPDVVVADQNASSDYARFYPAAAGVAALDHDLVYAERWTHADLAEQWRHGSIVCAETLVPDSVHPAQIEGVYVSSPETQGTVESMKLGLPVYVKNHLFFR